MALVGNCKKGRHKYIRVREHGKYALIFWIIPVMQEGRMMSPSPQLHLSSANPPIIFCQRYNPGFSHVIKGTLNSQENSPLVVYNQRLSRCRTIRSSNAGGVAFS